PALQCRGAAPSSPLLLVEEDARRVCLGERRRRGCCERLRVPPVLRTAVPGTARSQLTPGELFLAWKRRPRDDEVRRRGLPDVLRPRCEGAHHLAQRRGTAGCTHPSRTDRRRSACVERSLSSGLPRGSQLPRSGPRPLA